LSKHGRRLPVALEVSRNECGTVRKRGGNTTTIQTVGKVPASKHQANFTCLGDNTDEHMEEEEEDALCGGGGKKNTRLAKKQSALQAAIKATLKLQGPSAPFAQPRLSAMPAQCS
jgi:hypothetical protein